MALAVLALLGAQNVRADERPYEGLICQYTDWDCQRAYRVMLCESSGNPSAVSMGQIGLFQIAYRYHTARVASADALYDPETNIEVAHAIWSEQGFGPWPVCGRR